MALTAAVAVGATSAVSFASDSAQPREVIDLSNREDAPRTANAPFGDLTVGMVYLRERWQSTAAAAFRVGFHVDRLAFAGRLGSNIQSQYRETLPDDYQVDDEFVAEPRLFMELSLGYALVASHGFVTTPALGVMRTDNPAYGTAFGLEWSVVWVSRHQLRIGFEPGLWAAFGGYRVAECSDPEAACLRGDRVELSRPFSYGTTLNVVVGFELDSPQSR